MLNVVFKFQGIETKIQCNIHEKLEKIFDKFVSKVGIDMSQIYSLYNGNKIDEKLSVKDIINEEDTKRNTMNILVDKVNEGNNINEKIIKSKEIICPECNENILININNYKFNLNDCKNGHNNNNILLNEFENLQNIDISKIICNDCKENNKGNTFNNNFYRCCTCKNNICPLCKSFHSKEHKIINFENKNYICDDHNMNYIKYCKDCKLNLCIRCAIEHKEHNNIDFTDIIPNEEENRKEMNELKEYINKLNEDINNNIIIKLNKVKENIEIFYKIYNNIFNDYNYNNINYELLHNIKEFKNFNNTIIKDITKIINDNNIKNKFNNIIDIYNNMNDKLNNIIDVCNNMNNKFNYKVDEYNNMNNNKKNNINNNMNDKMNNNVNNNENNEYNYNYKINYKFEKEPKDLKFKIDITHTNDNIGSNDIFEVFISYKDNKEYIISKNTNFELDIFSLLDNKKIKSLKGHENKIKTVRYFINNKDYNEYIISGDNDKIVIIWDITDNYNIKYKIDTNYSNSIYSCLIVFPININDNYIITSSYNISNDNEISSTKIYSLNNGKFIKYIYNSNNIKIWYLLSWFNKKNNKYYIIQIASEKIVINNLLEDELYSELINQPENIHYSGFIFNKNNIDYLCSSSTNGYINIWDLYNKKIFKVINTYNCKLYHIIQWNNKYIIVADYNNKSFKIINIENDNIVDINGQLTESVKCVKKIYLPQYGESLLTASNDNTIKLWTI